LVDSSVTDWDESLSDLFSRMSKKPSGVEAFVVFDSRCVEAGAELIKTEKPPDAGRLGCSP